MTDLEPLIGALERTLVAHGFTTQRDLKVIDTRFDLVAEDDTRLVFIEVRTSNAGWLDDFYSRQATLDTAISDLELGRKRRDVYLLEVTTEAIDTSRKLEVAEAIQSDTATARKLVIDASGTDPSKKSDVEGMLAPILSGVDVAGPRVDIDVLRSLRDQLLKEGFAQRTVDRLIAVYGKEGHDCVELLLEEISDEAEND